MGKIALYGDPLGSYNFPIAGSRLLYSAVNTALPNAVVPIDNTNIPTNWNDAGPTQDSVIDVTITLKTGEIVTGAIAQTRRIYIEGQTGKVACKVMDYEPQKLGDLTGQGGPVHTATSSNSRGFKDLFFGGQLGNQFTFLIFQDFDINLTEDTAGDAYQQVWVYSPKAQKMGNINLSGFVTKTPVIDLEWELLPYQNVVAGSRDILLQQRWLELV